MNLSLDGFMSGPHGELDWHVESWSKEMGDKLLELLEQTDTLVLGRITYEAMAKYWGSRPFYQDFPRQDQALADKMNRHEKIVFTGKSATTYWNNTKIVHGDVVEEIAKLRRRSGKDILIFGSGKLVSSCVHSGLVDEYLLWIHPILLGNGKLLFHNVQKILKLKLTDAAELNPGIAVLRYQPGE